MGTLFLTAVRWFYRHTTLLLSTAGYTIAIMKFGPVSGVAGFCYRLAFLSAAVTYGIVVFKPYRLRMQNGGGAKLQKQVLSLLGDDNVPYFGKILEERRLSDTEV